MTTQDLIDWFGNNHIFAIAYFAVIIIVALLSNVLVNRTNISNLKYVMSVLVYGVTIPGVLAILLILYSILFLRASILNVNIVAHFLPIVSMIITLFILSRKVKMSQLPGFGKLSSLIILISIVFMLIFVLQRTYFGVIILGGFTQVLLVFAVLFIILKIAWSKLSK